MCEIELDFKYAVKTPEEIQQILNAVKATYEMLIRKGDLVLKHDEE